MTKEKSKMTNYLKGYYSVLSIGQNFDPTLLDLVSHSVYFNVRFTWPWSKFRKNLLSLAKKEDLGGDTSRKAKSEVNFADCDVHSR